MNDTPNQPAHDEHQPYAIDAPLNAWIAAARQRPSTSPFIRIDALGIADAQLGFIPNATLIVRHDSGQIQIQYAGATDALPAQFDSPDMPLLTLHDRIILPALVNAHTHLDLTHIGPQPHEPNDGFVRWVEMIRSNRATQDEDIERHVRLGIEKSLAGGVIAVGDIAGAPAGRWCDAPAKTLAQSPLIGVSYLEFFGIGSSAAATTLRLSRYLDQHAPNIIHQLQSGGVQLGLQPHAPNTVDLGVYRWVSAAAQARGMPICTHLAETREEHQFISEGTGPHRAMLERFGVWDDSVLDCIAKGKHPIEHLRPALEITPYLVAHVNDADDAGIELLAQSKTSVVYCPRASCYFGASDVFGPHRYRDMLQAGVNVCLGTDSIVNLDTPDRMSTLDEIRLLAANDASAAHDTRLLMALCTTHGAYALQLDPDRFRLGAGMAPMGLISVRIEHAQPAEHPDIWAQAMRQTNAPEWLFLEQF